MWYYVKEYGMYMIVILCYFVNNSIYSILKIFMTSKNAINLCSLNVNGINLKEKRNRVIEWFKAQKSLITVLQETHFDVNIENDLNHKSDYDVSCSHGTTASRGLQFV